MGPYAWQRDELSFGYPVGCGNDVCHTQHPQRKPKLERGVQETKVERPRICISRAVAPPTYLKDEALAALPRTPDAFGRIEDDCDISYELPKPKASAGSILQHAMRTFNKLHEKLYPMTFKFGITHDPQFRWRGAPFAYIHDRPSERFTNMMVTFASSDPIAPAFLEAALIGHFGSVMAKD